MTETKLEFLSQGFKDILNSEGVRAELEKQAAQIQAKAEANAPGAGFSSKVWSGNYGGGRYVASVTSAGASVYSEDYAGLLAEANQQALSKAVR